MKVFKIPLFLILGILLSQCRKETIELETSIPGNLVRAIYIDDDGVKWIGTSEGLASFYNNKWAVYTTQDKLAHMSVNDLAYQASTYGPEIWAATDGGASVHNYTIDAVTASTAYRSDNSGLGGDTVQAVAVDTGKVR